MVGLRGNFIIKIDMDCSGVESIDRMGYDGGVGIGEGSNRKLRYFIMKNMMPNQIFLPSMRD